MRAKKLSPCHNLGMRPAPETPFQARIQRLVGITGGFKKLAALSRALAKNVDDALGVTDGAIRDWRDRKGAEEGSKAGKFARAIGLTRAQLVGETPIPSQWWADFESKYGVENSLKTKLVNAVAKINIHTLSPKERDAVMVLIGEDGDSPSRQVDATEAVPELPVERKAI